MGWGTMVFNVLLFFVYIYGFGYALTRQEKGGSFETFFMRCGLGLGAFVVIGLMLNMFHVPLDWRIFLVLALGLPFFDAIKWVVSKKGQEHQNRHRGDLQDIGVIILACVLLVIFCKGAFSYRWLEDDDPWFHAAGTKYVAVEKNVNVAQGEFQYMNPYPPGYDLVMGVLHQTAPSLMWTLKFFNSLIVCLGLVFFYFWIKRWTQNKSKALLASFFLFCIPCYLTHFIWAHAYVITLFFPCFYFSLLAIKEKRLIFPAIVIFAAIFLLQPTQSLKFFTLYGLWVFIRAAVRKRVSWQLVMIMVCGVGLSLALWWLPQVLVRAGGEIQISYQDKLKPTELNAHTIKDKNTLMKTLRSQLNPRGGSSTKSFGLEEYFFIPKPNGINVSRGIGLFLGIMALYGLFYVFQRLPRADTEGKEYYVTCIIWMFFIVLGLNSETFQLPVGLYAFRFWLLLAIPVVLFASECVFAVVQNKKIFYGLLVVSCVCVFVDSGLAKIRVNTSIWKAGRMWPSSDEMKGYMSLKTNLPLNSRVFSFIDNFLVVGFDMESEFWRSDFKDTFKEAFRWQEDRLAKELRKRGYQFVILGQREMDYYGQNAFFAKLSQLQLSPDFKQVYTFREGVWIFKCV